MAARANQDPLFPHFPWGSFSRLCSSYSEPEFLCREKGKHLGLKCGEFCHNGSIQVSPPNNMCYYEPQQDPAKYVDEYEILC